MRPSNTAIILDLARGQQEAVVQHARDLDTKAAALLGFAGLLLGLLFSSELAVHHWNALLTAGTVLLGTALLPLGATLYPLRLRLNPDLEKLAYKDDRRAMAELESLVASSLQRSIRVGMGMVRAKSRLVRAGSVLIALAVAVITSRFVFVLTAAESASAAFAPVAARVYL